MPCLSRESCCATAFCRKILFVAHRADDPGFARFVRLPRSATLRAMIAAASWSLVGVAAFASTASAPKRVGVVIANGFEMLDAIGPFEVFKEIENTYFAHVNLTSQTWSDTALQPGIQCSADGGPPLHVEVEWVADSLTPVTSISAIPRASRARTSTSHRPAHSAIGRIFFS